MVWNLVDVHINRYKYLYYRITLVSIDIQANLGIPLTSFSEGKHLDWLSILLSMVMISHYGLEFS